MRRRSLAVVEVLITTFAIVSAQAHATGPATAAQVAGFHRADLCTLVTRRDVASLFPLSHGAQNHPSCAYLANLEPVRVWEWSLGSVRLDITVNCRRGCGDTGWSRTMTGVDYFRTVPDIRRVKVGRYIAWWHFGFGGADLFIVVGTNVVLDYKPAWKPHVLPHALVRLARKWSATIATAIWHR